MEREYDLIVVGAGAAGLMCAGTAAGAGLRVLLLDKNKRIGRKILITGKGRCNVTNDCEPDEFIRAVRSNGRFMYSAINAFTPADTIRFFEQLGVPLKTERGRRVFPQSDKAVDIVDALERYIRRSGAEFDTAQVQQILCEDGRAVGVKTVDGQIFRADSVVVATGGLSYPLTGSSGDGYRFAEQVGHSVVPTEPSLVPMVTREKWCSRLMGLSLRNVTLTVAQEGKKKPIYREMGEMLFTHFGVSGPLVLSASSHMTGDLSRYTMSIDLKPALSFEQLDARLLRDFEKFINKDFSNALDELLPKKLIPIAIELAGIACDCKVHQITREQRQQLAKVIKQLSFHAKAFRPVEEAIVTAGGVKTAEINPQTMQSKLVQGLYFVGEVLDLDAYTGGYNLQIAFSTGYLAAVSIAGGQDA